jgi:SAM-dependent methyltransferase
MTRLLGDHSLTSASKRVLHLLRSFGVGKAVSVCLATIDDQFLKSFDRKYRVRTSGYISLASTSFDPSKLPHATSYGAVNAWAFRWLLKRLALPKALHFVDLGCGLGRACILAAEYGFEKVTGVELAPELCVIARKNVSSRRLPEWTMARTSIVQGDALEYCGDTEDDVFFIYRAFSLEFFGAVLKKLSERAALRKKPLTIIYTERLYAGGSDCAKAFSEDETFRKVYEGDRLGQAFYVYQCAGQS